MMDTMLKTNPVELHTRPSHEMAQLAWVLIAFGLILVMGGAIATLLLVLEQVETTRVVRGVAIQILEGSAR